MSRYGKLYNIALLITLGRHSHQKDIPPFIVEMAYEIRRRLAELKSDYRFNVYGSWCVDSEFFNRKMKVKRKDRAFYRALDKFSYAYYRCGYIHSEEPIQAYFLP